MSILSFKNRIPNPSLLNNPLNEGALQAVTSNLLTKFFQIGAPNFVPTVENLRSVEWSKLHLWAFKFVINPNYGPQINTNKINTASLTGGSAGLSSIISGATSGKISTDSLDQESYSSSVPPFYVNWVPALSLEDKLASVGHDEITTTYNAYPLPKSSTAPTLTIEFADDINGTLYKWFYQWMYLDMFGRDDVSQPERYVLPLREACRSIQYMRLSPKYETIDIFNYLVVPAGDLVYIGNSDSGLRTFSITFNVVGKVDKGNQSETLEKSGFRKGLDTARKAFIDAKRAGSQFGFNPFF